MGSLQLALWIILVLNDAFVLTIDYKRTNTYVGCIATQVAISITAILVNTLALSFQPEWDTYTWLLMYQIGAKHLVTRYSNLGFILIGIPTLWGAFLSLCLLVVMLGSLLKLRPSISIFQLWKRNTKEVLLEITTPLRSAPSNSLSGHLREVPLSVPNEMTIFRRQMKKVFSNLLFRRVSPVESRMYAFSRNVFAVLAIVVILLRTITALLSAQNQIGSRTVSTACSNDDTLRFHHIQVLVENTLNPSPPNSILVKSGDSQGVCDVQESQIRHFSSRNMSVVIFDCGISTKGPFVDYLSSNEPQVFHIEVRSAEPNTSALLNSKDMPRIWLLNQADQPQTTSSNIVDSYTHASRTYLPAWELHRGFHVEAEARLITRKTIKSSIWRDVLLHSEPVYGFSSLYPIVESSVGTFNYPNASIATATIAITLKPGFMHFRNQAGIPSPVAFTAGVCDIIEDYRSSTVLDVIGSIGGLFALLQTAHVLLFGRPLFWGLTGAKLITPFGLLGACSSRGFKRRLRERYHGGSEEAQYDTILIGAFLRDFVIEFGPADDEQEYHVPRNSSLDRGNEEDTAGVQRPLIHHDSAGASTLRGCGDTEQSSTNNQL
ncbi:hypothetical protein ACGC1H_006472 [Rhizoctonia solani]